MDDGLQISFICNTISCRNCFFSLHFLHIACYFVCTVTKFFFSCSFDAFEDSNVVLKTNTTGEQGEEQHNLRLCLYLADPATFVASNSVLGTIFSSKEGLCIQLWK